MPYATNNSCRIHYEVEGDGPPLLLQHGFTQSLENWKRNGYVQALRDRYKLILVDARGHGLSDKPHDPHSYDAELKAADVVAVLDAVGVEKTHFWGFSMGGSIGFALAWCAPKRLASLVICGAEPYPASEAFATFKQEFGEVLAGGHQTVIAWFEKSFAKMGHKLPDERRQQILASDLVAWRANMDSPGSNDQIVAALKKFSQPALFYTGTQDGSHDKAKRISSEMKQAEFVSLEGYDHGRSFVDSKMALSLVTPFLRRVAVA